MFWSVLGQGDTSQLLDEDGPTPDGVLDIRKLFYNRVKDLLALKFPDGGRASDSQTADPVNTALDDVAYTFKHYIKLPDWLMRGGQYGRDR